MDNNKGIKVKQKVKQEVKQEVVIGVPELLKSKNTLIEKAKQIFPTNIVKIEFSNFIFRLQENTKLRSCTLNSLQSVFIEVLNMELSFAKSASEIYIVPYFNKEIGANEAQINIGYQGLQKLILEANPNIEFIMPNIVRSSDLIKISFGNDATLEHTKDLLNNGKIIGAYCYAQYKSGKIQPEYMSILELENVRQHSKSPNSPAWTSFKSEMYKKIVLRRFSKRLRKSQKLSNAVQIIDNDYNMK